MILERLINLASKINDKKYRNNVNSFNLLNIKLLKLKTKNSMDLGIKVSKTCSKITNQDIKEKHSIRKKYTVKQLLSIRNQFTCLPTEIKHISGIIEESIGKYTGSTLKKSKKNYFSDMILTEEINIDYSTQEKNEKQCIKKLRQISLTSVKKRVKKSSEAWNRNRIKTRQDVLKSKLTGMMNKLTVEKFNRLASLFTKFIKSEINTKEELKTVVSLMFAKIVKEDNFGPLYANLCSNISRIKIVSFLGDELVNSSIFIQVLIDQCQREFEKAFKNIKVINSDNLEVKKSALGTIKFIGEFYKKGLLPNKICKICLTNLLHNDPVDLQIECAYTFLLNVGKKYDGTRFGKKHLNKVFKVFFNLKQNRKYEIRTRILMDICISTRENNWKPIRKEQTKSLKDAHRNFQSVDEIIKLFSSKDNSKRATLADFSKRCEKINKFSIKGGVGINYSYYNERLLKSKPNFAKCSQKTIEKLLCISSNFELENIFIETFMNKLIQDFLILKDIPKEKKRSKKFFLKQCKNVKWPNKKQLVISLFDFCFKSSCKNNVKTIGLLLVYLQKISYISIEDIEFGLTNSVKSHLLHGNHIEKTKYYFLICSELLNNRIIDFSFIKQTFLKDTAKVKN